MGQGNESEDRARNDYVVTHRNFLVDTTEEYITPQRVGDDAE